MIEKSLDIKPYFNDMINRKEKMLCERMDFDFDMEQKNIWTEIVLIQK